MRKTGVHKPAWIKFIVLSISNLPMAAINTKTIPQITIEYMRCGAGERVSNMISTAMCPFSRIAMDAPKKTLHTINIICISSPYFIGLFNRNLKKTAVTVSSVRLTALMPNKVSSMADTVFFILLSMIFPSPFCCVYFEFLYVFIPFSTFCLNSSVHPHNS